MARSNITRFTHVHRHATFEAWYPGAAPAASSGPGVNTPLTIFGTSLLCWYRSDLGISLNGSNVSAWADQSGNGYHLSQGSATSQPAYVSSGGVNGLPYVLYTESSIQVLRNAVVQPAQPFEYWIVLRPTDGNAGAYFYAVDWSVSSPNNNVLLQPPAGSTLQLYPGPTTATLSLTDHWIDCAMNGASTSIAVDGGTPVVGSVTATPNGGLSVGNIALASPVQAWDGFIYEFFAVSRLSTGPENTATNAYLSGRY